MYAYESSPNPFQDYDFQVYGFEGKLILRHAASRKFVCEYSGKIVVEGDGIDESCKFLVDTAAILPVKEEIISLTWGELDFEDLTPKIAASKTVENHGSETAEMDITVEWSYTESSETTLRP